MRDSLFLKLQNRFTASLHQPFRCACCATDTDTLGIRKPRWVNVTGFVHKVTLSVDLLTLLIEHLSVRTFQTTDKEHHIMACGEITNIRQAIGHLTANRVKVFKHGGRLNRLRCFEIPQATLLFGRTDKYLL